MADTSRTTTAASRIGLRTVALAYVGLILLLPVGLLFWRTFENGVGEVWNQLTDPSALHAFRITLIVAFFTVLGNTIFGLGASVLLVRHQFPGKRVLNALIDLPFAVSPVVVGLALILVYGPHTSTGGWLADRGVDVIFAVPGMVIATIFVSLPLVVREVVPVLQEIGDEQADNEQDVRPPEHGQGEIETAAGADAWSHGATAGPAHEGPGSSSVKPAARKARWPRSAARTYRAKR